MRFSVLLGMPVRKLREGATRLHCEKGFGKCRLNQWCWALDTGSLTTWRTMGDVAFKRSVRSEKGWARKLQPTEDPQSWPWEMLADGFSWSTGLANVAAGHSALCSGTLHAEAGYLTEAELTVQQLSKKLEKLDIRYPYGRSVNACRATNISPLLYEHNWPEDP